GAPWLSDMYDFPFRLGQREAEDTPFARPRFDPDAAMVAVDHLFTDGEADARAGVGALVVQALEHHEDALVVLGFDADAVVLDRELPFRGFLRCRYFYLRRLRAPELDRIPYQILQQLHDLHVVDGDLRQRVVRDLGAAFLDRRAQVDGRAAQQVLHLR